MSGRIGINDGIESPKLWFENDRLLLDWLKYAGRYDDKTTDRHLSTIRFFEDIIGGKSFRKLTLNDVHAFRDDLRRRAKNEAPDSLSASSIRHHASHLQAFLEWMSKQAGYKRLPQGLVDNLRLPKAVTAKAAQVKQKDYPTITEAEDLLRAMPFKSLAGKRSRAVFALAFLGALRADTVVSLRMKHFDIERRRIVQDGRVSRTKAGKSFEIVWQPIPKIFEEMVVDWKKTLLNLGFRDDDALFPHLKYLKHRPQTLDGERKLVPVLSTYHVVTKAFELACQDSDTMYTPHAAKHTIAAVRDTLPLTQRQRAAMSANMGHENERITEQHYGKMSNEQRIEVMESISDASDGESQVLSDEGKIALVDGILRELKRG